MKKLIYSLIVVVFCITATQIFIGVASGKTITSDVAQIVAANFFKQNADKPVKALSLAYTATSSSGDSVYFVFNINAVDGFVIVVADDAQYPVIGYSTEGSFVVPAPASNAGYWMEQRKKEIIANKMQNVQATTEISAQWTAYMNSKAVAPRVASTVSPLVKTLWDQPSPYNTLCPANCPTGCVATAMAQIMKYWNYPAKGIGSSSYNSPYGVIGANYGNTVYNWSDMPIPTIYDANNDVDTLMFQCGVSVEMDYTPNGSSASVTTYDDPGVCAQISYSKYFGYDPGTIQGLQQFNYTDQDWINIIETDLNANHPVQYAGIDTAYGGHSWVCDGYDAKNNLHMNWGFSGSDNGYFSINLLNPGGTFNFSNDNEVVVGIEPKASVPNDAGILSVISPIGTTCDLTITPVVRLLNFGISTLTFCTINYFMDTDPTKTYNWTGSLATGKYVDVTLPAMAITSGTHSFTAFTSNPNHAVDSDTANDQSIGSVTSVFPLLLPTSQGFEGSDSLPTDWSIWNSDVTTTSWQITTQVAHTGHNCIVMDNYDNNGSIYGTLERFTTTPYNLLNDTNVSLSFAVAYAPCNLNGFLYTEKLVVYYSIDCGATWRQCYIKGGTTLATALAFDGNTIANRWMPNSSQWRIDSIDLSSLYGQQNVMLAFENISGWGGWLYVDDISLSGTTAVGIPSIPAAESFRIYPNPATNQLTIHTSSSRAEKAIISIVNVLGQEVLSYSLSLGEGGEEALDISKLPSGMYFLEMKAENGSVVKRFVKE